MQTEGFSKSQKPSTGLQAKTARKIFAFVRFAALCEATGKMTYNNDEPDAVDHGHC